MSVWPRIISAPGEQGTSGVGDVGGLDEPAGGGAREAPGEHLLAVREVVEGAGLDDAAGDRVHADSQRGELDREIADERLEGRLRGSDQT